MKFSVEERVALKLANVVREREDMHHYQDGLAVPFMKANPFSALFVDMGLGKTISSLTVLVDLLMEFTYEHVLIVGPLKVATETWPTEIGLWGHTAPFNFEVIHAREDDPGVKRMVEKAKIKAKADALDWGLPKDQAAKFVAFQMQKAETAAKNELRRRKARSKATIHIISRDWLEWLVNFWGPKWPYRCVIIDESSGFKDHKSGRFKSLAKVRRSPGLIERLHLLTATPAAESYEHLWSQIYLLDLGARLGKNITTYRRLYFTENKWTRKWELRVKSDTDVILEKISDICLVMSAKDYLPDLTEPVIIQRQVHLGDCELDLYERLQKNFVVELQDGTEIEAETAAALSAKLLQLASGVLYETQRLQDWDTEDFKKVRKVHHIHDHKIDALRQIVEEAQGEPLLVAYHFKSSLDRLKKAFPKAVVMDKDGRCIKSWNAKKIPMLLVHPQSAGHGLNLQHGGHHLVFFDLPWSLELYLQTIGRLARQGQKHPVIVQLLCAIGTLDVGVHKALVNKRDAQDYLLRTLKRLIKPKLKLAA